MGVEIDISTMERTLVKSTGVALKTTSRIATAIRWAVSRLLEVSDTAVTRPSARDAAESRTVQSAKPAAVTTATSTVKAGVCDIITDHLVVDDVDPQRLRQLRALEEKEPLRDMEATARVLAQIHALEAALGLDALVDVQSGMLIHSPTTTVVNVQAKVSSTLSTHVHTIPPLPLAHSPSPQLLVTGRGAACVKRIGAPRVRRPLQLLKKVFRRNRQLVTTSIAVRMAVGTGAVAGEPYVSVAVAGGPRVSGAVAGEPLISVAVAGGPLLSGAVA